MGLQGLSTIEAWHFSLGIKHAGGEQWHRLAGGLSYSSFLVTLDIVFFINQFLTHTELLRVQK